VLDGAETADVAADRDVVGRVGEHHLGLLTGKQFLIGLLLECASTDDAVAVQEPQIAGAGDRGLLVRVG
jgi:hypothetical protein